MVGNSYSKAEEGQFVKQRRAENHAATVTIDKDLIINRLTHY